MKQTLDEQGEERWLDMLFDRSDSNGDGFIKYHDFIARYAIKPKPLQAPYRH